MTNVEQAFFDAVLDDVAYVDGLTSGMNRCAASDNNKIGVPAGWSGLDWQLDRWTGFSAGVYKNNQTNEIMAFRRRLVA
jgi:hypothetical protein